MSTDTSPNLHTLGTARSPDSNPIVIDGISYIPSSALLTGIHKTSFKDNRAFAVVDPQGECPRLYSGSELGVYFNDTRYLGVWEMAFNRQVPIALSRELRFGGHTAVFSMTNRDFPSADSKDGKSRIARDTFLIRRVMSLHQDTLYETVEIKNFDSVPHRLNVEQWCGGSFEDVFEVRGFPRARRGRMLPPEDDMSQGHRYTMLRYEGLDGAIRRTFIHRLFEAEKHRLSPSLAGYFTEVEVPAKGAVSLRTIVSFDELTDCKFHGQPYAGLSIADKMHLLTAKEDTSPFAPLAIETDHAIVNRAIRNAQLDIHMLLTQESPEVLYPYAGLPWFSAPFGRDGIITAYQMLPWYPKLARGVLDYVFGCLGSKLDAFTDEQPGKVFHEMRRGEMSRTREVPFLPYYGSVDSTPLALILLHEYVRWTGDLTKLKDWWPDAMRALEWVRVHGDLDRDGFIEYAMKSTTGLVNQGWKDSGDSIMHADGRLARAPIRLCEAQGYAFRARLGMSELARMLGKPELSQELRLEALRLKASFHEKFWDSEGRFVVLALDGDSQPCAVRSSNMGHCLWTEILHHGPAGDVSRHLMSDAMFSGYGIRTLADTERAYNPLSYHNGSVWPHDNSLIMEGFRLYNQVPELERLAVAMIGVLEASDDMRLPELFCGFRKRGHAPPIPYEVACKPQAWAAGAIFLMLKSMLGISKDVEQDHLVFHNPILTPRIQAMEIRGLGGKDWELDVALRRAPHGGTSVDVLRRVGNLRVLTVR